MLGVAHVTLACSCFANHQPACRNIHPLTTLPHSLLPAGNDFSTLYAPLIRDGRMEKYYWNPTREDRVGVCMGIFNEDNLNRQQVETLVDAFPGQSIDFFGALRARVYDDKVRRLAGRQLAGRQLAGQLGVMCDACSWV
jgi:hypothetical protein